MSRRADRLFQIVQYLRGRRLTTALQLSEWLNVSERTIYRDIRDLSCSGVPIEGEAGVGYRLNQSFDLPPLMFDVNEIDALVMGVRMVSAWGSPELAQAAEMVLSKIRSVLPNDLRIKSEQAHLYVPKFFDRDAAQTLALMRQAMQQRYIVAVDYSDQYGQISERRLWPLGLFFWGNVWTLAAFCELRQEFRTFRIDRVRQVSVLDEIYPDQHGYRLNDYLRAMRAECGGQSDVNDWPV
jgi:predicted DNA-binding transcriptional regulator YafY